MPILQRSRLHGENAARPETLLSDRQKPFYLIAQQIARRNHSARRCPSWSDASIRLRRDCMQESLAVVAAGETGEAGPVPIERRALSRLLCRRRRSKRASRRAPARWPRRLGADRPVAHGLGPEHAGAAVRRPSRPASLLRARAGPWPRAASESSAPSRRRHGRGLAGGESRWTAPPGWFHPVNSVSSFQAAPGPAARPSAIGSGC